MPLKKKKFPSKFPCEECGHSFKQHDEDLIANNFCWVCWNDLNIPTYDVYHIYKPDNLKYLEQCSKSRGNKS